MEAGREREAPSKYDEQYKKLFAFRRLVEDLLRAFVGGGRLARVDFSTLQKLSTEYVSDELLKRRGDTVWRLRVGGRWAFLLLLLEFQSRDDRYMALRILNYTGLLYQELVRNEAPEAQPRLPAVLPVVLYNGTAPWDAPLEVRDLIAPVGKWLTPYQPSQRYFVVDEQRVDEDAIPSGNLMRAVIGLEQSRTPADLARVASALSEWLAGPENARLRDAFTDWIRSSIENMTPAGEAVPALENLEEVRMSLEERVKEWPAQWMREGREEGREEGLEHERGLLCRMAALRFGAETGERLAPLLTQITDAEYLTEAGEWLVRCKDGSELLAKVELIARS